MSERFEGGRRLRTLVSGATGFIGRALATRLGADGGTITRAVRRDPGPNDVLIDARARRVDARRLPGGTLEGFDAVFHLMGEPITPARWGPRKREAIRASRVSTTYALARALGELDTPPAVLVCASAVGVYGDRGEEVLDEESAGGSGFLAEVCRAWEAAATPARDRGIRVVHVRTGLVLGAGGGYLAPQLPLFRAGLGARLGNGRQWQSWVALDDVVAALVHVAEQNTIAGPCNLVAPEPVRNGALTDAIAAAVNRRAWLAVPAFALRLALGANAHEIALVSQRVVPRRLVESGFVHRFGDLSAALARAVDGDVQRRFF